MSNETIYTFKSVLKRQVISEETSEKMRHALECVVAYATGKKAYLNGYRVGGKTGTAQIAENGAYVDGKYVLSFIAAAPMNDPQVAVYFAIREPKSTIQYGGTTVGPIIQNILRDVLPYLNVSKQDGGLKKIYTWMDEKYHAVSNYIGLTKKEVKSTLYKFNLQRAFGLGKVRFTKFASFYVFYKNINRFRLCEWHNKKIEQSDKVFV